MLGLAAAIVYVPDAADPALAARPVAGRSLALRAVMAATRAGATAVGVPRELARGRLAAELARVPAATRTVRWLEAGADADPVFTDAPCLLVPVSTLVPPATLRALLARGSEGEGAVLEGTAARGAPVVAVAPGPVQKLWDRLAMGEAVGEELTRHVESVAFVTMPAAGASVEVGDGGARAAEDALFRAMGTDGDTGVDRFLHRRVSRALTSLLVRTPVTPNQVSLASLALGLAAAWALWHATAASAAAGVVLYALASIVDHSDGELARLTFRESRLGAHLDWLVDTVIHASLVLAMAVTAGGPVLAGVGVAAASGVTLSALLARKLPREIEVGPSLGGALRHMGNRDLFYAVLLVFVALRGAVPSLLPALAVLVATGSQCYWLACLAHLRRAHGAEAGRAGHPA
ncbi:MAG: CDP-alcohol phosphatidyltransferase family protein [Candidatus Rokuibacteriota bacterium]